MGLARDPVDRVSGTTTPPPLMGIDMLVEHELLVMGQEYWVEDEEGEDVWTLGEVVEQEEGRVTVNLSQYGRRREVDRVSIDTTKMKHIQIEVCNPSHGHMISTKFCASPVLSQHFLL